MIHFRIYNSRILLDFGAKIQISQFARFCQNSIFGRKYDFGHTVQWSKKGFFFFVRFQKFKLFWFKSWNSWKPFGSEGTNQGVQSLRKKVFFVVTYDKRVEKNDLYLSFKRKGLEVHLILGC